MSTPLSHTSIRFGRIPDATELSATCSAGDIHHHHVTFATPFPNSDVRVIGTGVAPDTQHVPTELGGRLQGAGRQGQRLHAEGSELGPDARHLGLFLDGRLREADNRTGWRPTATAALDMGIVQPRAFAQTGDFPHLDWQQWRHVP